MADDKSRGPDETGKSKRSGRFHFSDLILFIELLLGLKAGLGEEVSQEAANLFRSGLNLGSSALAWALGLLRHPLLVGVFLLYFIFLPLLAIIFFILGFWISGFWTVAYALAIAQMALIILTTWFLTVFVRRGKGKGFFFRLVLFLNALEFIGLSLLNFFIILPAGIFSSLQYVTLVGLMVALIPLSVLVQSRWTWGWVIIYILSVGPLIAHLLVPDGAMKSWVGERHAWQAYTRVVTTEPLRVYNDKGKLEGGDLPAGDTLYVDFSHRVKVYDRLYAFRCYTDFIGGNRVYLPLIRGSNYYHLTPAPAGMRFEKAVEIRREAMRPDTLRDTTGVQQ